MEIPRCMSWKEFKESLDNMVGKKILYIDEEGTEIPINTDTEFQEALRLAKRQGNRVRFVLVKEEGGEAKSSARQNSKAKEKYAFKDSRHSKGWVNESEYKEAKEAVYVNDAAPEWFLSYMKKFKKDLLADVNNSINDTLRKAFKKEAKLYDERLAKDYEWEMANQEMNCVGTQYYYRSDSGYETPAYFVASQPLPASGSIRIRSTDKVYLDQMRDERRVKQYGKTDKIRPNPLEKRLKQDKWMNAPSIVKENGVMASKARPYPKVYVTYAHDFGPIKPMKSASFTSNLSLKKLEVLQPYALWFLLGNNGIVPWSNNAYVKCFYNPDEFEFEDNVIDLPSLETGVGANVVYEVTPLKVGSFSFTCAIMDSGVEIGERILCRFEVVDEEGMKVGKSTKMPTKKEAEQLCEHYDDEFTKTQKKIKENIKTIMKRLDDIEVLNSEPKGAEKDSKKKEDESVRIGQKRNRKKRKEISTIDGSTIEFRTGVFDLLQNLESIRENEEGKPKDDEKEIVKEALVGVEDKKEVKEDKKDKHDENGKKIQEEAGECDQKDEGKKEDAETDKRDSDSELSVIMGSEEDDNFIVLSMPSRTSTPETEVKELENDKDKDQDKENAKEKDVEKDKDATPNESPREEKKTTLESNTFDPWNEKKNRESGRFDPWNEKKTQPDSYDDEMLKSGKWTKLGSNFVPEGAKKVKKSHIRFFDSFDFPEDVVAKLKSKGMNIEDASYYVAHEATFFNPDVLKNENVVYVVDNGGKCVPVVNGRQTGYAEAEKRQGSAEAKKRQEIAEAKKRQEMAEAKKRQEIAEAKKRQENAEAKKRQENAEAKKRQENAEAKKRQENAEAKKRQESAEAKAKDKESQGESSYGFPEGSPTGSEQPTEGMDHSQGKDLPNLLLYSAASDAITKVASVFNNIHSAFQNKGADKNSPTENNKRTPIKVMEALKILEDMGFSDKIRNRELLMVHNLNLSKVIEDLVDKTPRFRDSPPKGIFMSKQGVYGRL